MKLEVMERLMLLGILPREGGLRTMRVVAELQRELGLTAAEIADWEVTDQLDESGRPTGITWNTDKAGETEIDLAGVKTEIIVAALRKLDSDGKLTVQHLSLCGKFPLDAKADKG